MSSESPVITNDYLVDAETGRLRFTRSGRRKLETMCLTVGVDIKSIQSLADFQKMLDQHPEFVRRWYGTEPESLDSPREFRECLLTSVLTGDFSALTEALNRSPNLSVAAPK